MECEFSRLLRPNGPASKRILAGQTPPRTRSELEMPNLKLLEDDDRKERLVQQIVGRQLLRPPLCRNQFWRIAGRQLRRRLIYCSLPTMFRATLNSTNKGTTNSTDGELFRCKRVRNYFQISQTKRATFNGCCDARPDGRSQRGPLPGPLALEASDESRWPGSAKDAFDSTIRTTKLGV